jgi:hypothetical protein
MVDFVVVTNRNRREQQSSAMEDLLQPSTLQDLWYCGVRLVYLRNCMFLISRSTHCFIELIYFLAEYNFKVKYFSSEQKFFLYILCSKIEWNFNSFYKLMQCNAWLRMLVWWWEDHAKGVATQVDIGYCCVWPKFTVPKAERLRSLLTALDRLSILPFLPKTKLN